MGAPLLQVDGLTKSVGTRMLFADVRFTLEEGDKVGLIAKNGTGKTTLLRILAGEEAPDSGSIIPRKGLRVGYLAQIPPVAEATGVLDACLKLVDRRAIESEGLEGRAQRMLTQLGLDDHAAITDTLSGGQRKRIALAALLLSEPELIILDEPTNHLDIQVIEWLENRLARSRVTLLLVTHDRYFLDRVTTRIIELDQAQAFEYQGNYAEYLRRRAERINAMDSQLAKARNTLRKEQEWMSRQPQARAGKARFRIEAFHALTGRERSLRRQDRDIALDVKSSYIGSKIFEAQDVCKSFGTKKILDNFTYTFARYEKVGIVGHNGVGKTTLIKILQGILPPDSGSVDIGQTVRFGYYSQTGIDFNPGKRVIDAITEIAEEVVVNDGQARFTPMQFLQRFLFSPADQQKYISTLSGGERCRLHLAAVLMRSPNFLILDEPTNDLDIITLAILEEYLREFKGCVIVVSHDRFFLDSIVDHLFVLEGDGVVRDFPGNYSDYRQFLQEQKAAEAPAVAAEKPKRTQRERPPKMTFAERKEFEALDAKIEALTAEKAELEAVFASGADAQAIAAASERYSALKEELDEAELRWLELSEKEGA